MSASLSESDRNTALPQNDVMCHKPTSLNQFVCAVEQYRRHLNPQRLCSFQIDNKLDLCGKFDRKIAGRGTLTVLRSDRSTVATTNLVSSVPLTLKFAMWPGF
jgi:hypothetical protein